MSCYTARNGQYVLVSGQYVLVSGLNPGNPKVG